MDKKEFIEKLNSLDLELGEYYILSSGSLLLYGLRERAGDIDLCVSPKAFDLLKDKYNLTEECKNEHGFYKVNDGVEVVVNDKNNAYYKFEYDVVEGYPVQKLGYILRDKRKRNLPKDQIDIKNINEFLTKNFGVCNIKDKPEYIPEIAFLTQKEWGKKCKTQEEFELKVNLKIDKIKKALEEESYCKLVLLFKNNLVGFISIFPNDCEERKNLTPWYATMYVKEEYRKMGYSKILNDAILEEGKKMEFKKLYLKTKLENYYEKFGAKYLETLENGEKIFYFEL